MGNTLNRQHRTAVFVRRSADSANDYVERTAALVGSLNRPPDYVAGGTVKVDVYTVVGSRIETGLVDVVSGPTNPSSKLAQLAADEGFEVVSSNDVTPVSGVVSDGGRLDSPTLRRLAEEAGYTVVVVVTGNNDS